MRWVMDYIPEHRFTMQRQSHVKDRAKSEITQR